MNGKLELRGALQLLERAADKLDAYQEEIDGEYNCKLAGEIRKYLAKVQP